MYLHVHDFWLPSQRLVVPRLPGPTCVAGNPRQFDARPFALYRGCFAHRRRKIRVTGSSLGPNSQHFAPAATLCAMVMSDDAIEVILQKWAWAKGEEAAMRPAEDSFLRVCAQEEDH